MLRARKNGLASRPFARSDRPISAAMRGIFVPGGHSFPRSHFLLARCLSSGAPGRSQYFLVLQKYLHKISGERQKERFTGSCQLVITRYLFRQRSVERLFSFLRPSAYITLNSRSFTHRRSIATKSDHLICISMMT